MKNREKQVSSGLEFRRCDRDRTLQYHGRDVPKGGNVRAFRKFVKLLDPNTATAWTIFNGQGGDTQTGNTPREVQYIRPGCADIMSNRDVRGRSRKIERAAVGCPRKEGILFWYARWGICDISQIMRIAIDVHVQVVGWLVRSRTNVKDKVNSELIASHRPRSCCVSRMQLQSILCMPWHVIISSEGDFCEIC